MQKYKMYVEGYVEWEGDDPPRTKEEILDYLCEAGVTVADLDGLVLRTEEEGG